MEFIRTWHLFTYENIQRLHLQALKKNKDKKNETLDIFNKANIT